MELAQTLWKETTCVNDKGGKNQCHVVLCTNVTSLATKARAAQRHLGQSSISQMLCGESVFPSQSIVNQ